MCGEEFSEYVGKFTYQTHVRKRTIPFKSICDECYNKCSSKKYEI